MDALSAVISSRFDDNNKENCSLVKLAEGESILRKTQPICHGSLTGLIENQAYCENGSSFHVSFEEVTMCENSGSSRNEREKKLMKTSESASPKIQGHDIDRHSTLMLANPYLKSDSSSGILDQMDDSKPDFNSPVMKEIEGLITMNLMPMVPHSEEPNTVNSPMSSDFNTLFTKMGAVKLHENIQQIEDSELYFTASDDEGEDLNSFNWDLLPNFSISPPSILEHTENESYLDSFAGFEDAAFQRYDSEAIPNRPMVWWNIPDGEDKESNNDLIEQDARPDHKDLESTDPIANIQVAESNNFTSLDARALILSLHLDPKVKASEITEPTISKSDIDKREKIDALDNLLKKVDNFNGLACEDNDPATLRSMIRQSWSAVSRETLALMVSVHLVSVCKLLVESPLRARQYIQYCDSSKKYQVALGEKQQKLIKHLLDIFPFHGSKDSESPVHQKAVIRTYVRTTIACQTNQLCSDANLRKICEKLENMYNVRCVERSLEPIVSFAFDERSVSILATLPLQEGLQATSQWSSKLAKYLVLEGYIFDTVNIICIIAQPDATARTAVRNLGSTMAMLAKPAPKARIFLAQGVSDAALLVRTLIDSCAGDDQEWYRRRDRLPDYVQPEAAAQLALLQAFPRMTCLGAEIALLNSSLAHFLQASLVDANIGPILLEPTCPIASAPIAMPNQDVSMRYTTENTPTPILEPTVSHPEQTPTQQPRRKRRLTLTKQRGDSQMRLDWQYLQEENIE